MPRIKRFDEVDSDSELEFEEEQAPVRKTMPTLSFKTTTEETDSIAFESDREKSQHSDHYPPPATLVKVKPPPPAAAAPAVKAKPPTPPPITQPVKSAPSPPTIAGQAMATPAMPAKRKMEAAPNPPASPQEAHVVPTFPTAAAPPAAPPAATAPTPAAPSAAPAPAGPYVSAYTPRTQYSSPVHHRHDDPEDSDHGSDDFVQQVLPVAPRPQQRQQNYQQQQQRPPPAATVTSQLWASGASDVVESSRLRAAPAETAADELLIRAQLRLEERRRLGASAPRSGSRPPSPWRGVPPPAAMPAAVATPYRDSLPRAAAGALSPLTATDPRVRRLQQENARLQDEVAFLGRETQKLRQVQGSADASEAVRLQLTVDMLRKELETKQVAFQRALDDAHAGRTEAVRQAGEAAEQYESYQSSADQYRQLYGEKQRELEKVKTQLQALLYDVNTMEQRHREIEADYGEKIQSERERTERVAALAEDVKGQRDHLQFLNDQLRTEVTAAAEARRQAVDQAAAATDAARRDRAEWEQKVEVLNEDIAVLRRSLAEKERVQAGLLREAAQAQALLQERLKEAADEAQREAERSRRSAETTREDHKRALQAERARRAEVEEKLRRVEEEARANTTRHAASVGAESEGRVRRYREELQAERVAREAAEREAARLAAEVEELRDASDYYQQETTRLSANFGQSEQLREKAERQCVSLTHTLEDMMAQEETHARQTEQLQEALAAAQWGSVGMVGRSVDAEGMVGDLQQLSDENDRLTNECGRLAEERDSLIEENGKIAEELLKWKHEMRQYVTSHVRPPSPQSRRLPSGGRGV